ncbi:L10-interacting MYB domain-containing protein-like [Camellia sinensis]|uniref:L10-interacting MYB domain-containing protein-like n=1 Tax=Camellia sinensis TaxID=4442 RepID=UPI001036368D|nr:L10-interacting MYB domain-containing protein-like [Camellia sinensis]
MAATRSSPCTPSKNKGVGPSGTEGIVDGLDHAHKANWDSAAIEIFLQCVQDAILAGRRVGTTITKTGYNEIALKFTKRTGKRHNITQLKNKYGSLKKEWQAWNKLMDSSKGVTGIGFNRDTGLFTASEEWGDNLKSTNKIAYKFKTKLLEHKDLMRAVFTGATATGKHHWTPGEKPVDVGEGESDSVESPGLAPFTEPYRPIVNSPPNSPTIDLEEVEPGTKRKKGCSSSGKSKKVSSGASVLADSFNHLSKAVEAQKHLTVRHGTGALQKYSIEPCMQRLMAISDFISTPLFHFACTALENADYREILMCMPDDENVVDWLAQLQVSKGL